MLRDFHRFYGQYFDHWISICIRSGYLYTHPPCQNPVSQLSDNIFGALISACDIVVYPRVLIAYLVDFPDQTMRILM